MLKKIINELKKQIEYLNLHINKSEYSKFNIKSKSDINMFIVTCLSFFRKNIKSKSIELKKILDNLPNTSTLSKELFEFLDSEISNTISHILKYDDFKDMDEFQACRPQEIYELTSITHKKSDSNNYRFLDYLFLFCLMNIMDFTTVIQFLIENNIQLKYGNKSKNQNPIYSLKYIDKKNKVPKLYRGYEFCIYITPHLILLNSKSKETLSLKLKQPSYFIDSIISNNNVSFSFRTAFYLVLEFEPQLKYKGTCSLLASFNILNDYSKSKNEKIEKEYNEHNYQFYISELNEYVNNHKYVFDSSNPNNFGILNDFNYKLNTIYNNLFKITSENCKDGNIDNICSMLCLLSTLENLTAPEKFQKNKGFFTLLKKPLFDLNSSGWNAINDIASNKLETKYIIKPEFVYFDTMNESGVYVPNLTIADKNIDSSKKNSIFLKNEYFKYKDKRF